MEEKAKGSFLKAALIYGAIAGLVGILLSVVFYVLNVQFKFWAGILSLVVTIGVIVYCMKAYRDEYLGGYAKYGRLLLMALSIGIVSAVITVIYMNILVNYIDTEYVEKVKQFTIERVEQNTRLTDAQIEQYIDRTEERTTKARVAIRQPLVGGLIFSLIVGLIAAAILKREENPVSNVS